MVKAELSYNPYLLETKVKFNGQEPKINSLVEKYENDKLQTWLSEIRNVFYNEMNGYDFDLDFSGTRVDFEYLKRAFFEDKKVTPNDVRIFHKSELEDVMTKNTEIDTLLQWLTDNPNRRFNNDEFRADHTELFDDDYTYIIVQGNNIDTTVFDGYNITVENVAMIEEFPTDLDKTPILFYIDSCTRLKFDGFLKGILYRKDVIQDQLFFLVHPDLNKNQIERTIKDLGVKTPQMVNDINDDQIMRYLKVYPMTNYVYEAINVFKIKTDSISAILEVENETSKSVNAVIYEKIDALESVISKLKDANERFGKRDNFEISPALDKAKCELLDKIQNWRKKKIKIDNDTDAERIINSFCNDLNVYFKEFIRSIESIFTLENTKMESMYRVLYDTAEYQDGFEISGDNTIDLTRYQVPEMAEIFKSFRKEEMVPKQEALINKINPFVKRDVNSPIEVVASITYSYQQFRDKAKEVVEPMAMELINEITTALSNYYYRIDCEYIAHLKYLIEKQADEKEVASSQLSDDEKQLQNDNDWIVTFADKVKVIERG